MQKRLKPVTVTTDIPAAELDDSAYSLAENIYFRSGGSVRAEGYGPVYNPALLNEAQYLTYARTPLNTDFWVYFGQTQIAATDLVQHADISPASVTPTEVSDWVADSLNSIVIATNGSDAPIWWGGDPATPFAPMDDWPADTTCRFIRAYKNQALAGGIEAGGALYENQLYWSGSVAPGQPPSVWTPLPSNDAGDNILAQTSGGLVDGCALRDTFLLAKNHSLYSMTYTGGQFVFRFAGLSNSAGVLSRHCMAEVRGVMYLFSDGDMIATDGAQVRSIAHNRVKRTVFSEMNQALTGLCFVCPYLAREQLWFCYPSGSSTVVNRAAVYSLTDDSWGFRDLPDIRHAAQGIAVNYGEGVDWDGDTESWEEDAYIWDASGDSAISDGVLLGTDESLFGVAFQNSANGSAMRASLAKASMDFGAWERAKLVTSVHPNITGASGDVLGIRVGVQRFDSDPVKWGPVRSFVIGTTDKVDVSEAGRLISLSIEGETLTPWRCHSVAIQYTFSGFY